MIYKYSIYTVYTWEVCWQPGHFIPEPMLHVNGLKMAKQMYC